MTNNLPSVPKYARATLRILKAIGPFLLSQSTKASEAYAEHQMRLADVDIYKELMTKEIQSLANVRQKLLEKYYDSPEEERFQIKRDINDLGKEVRRLGVYHKAVEHVLSDSTHKPEEKILEASSTEISPPWKDRFDELACLQNEPWRNELLSRALASEAQDSGSITPRALWLIGTMEEPLFHAFASLIDVSSVILGKYIVPNPNKFYDHPITNCALEGKVVLGNLTHMLGDIGLLGNLLTSTRVIPAHNPCEVAYGSERYILMAKNEIKVKGILFTSLGNQIAALYNPTSNDLGKQMFQEWISSIKPDIGILTQAA